MSDGLWPIIYKGSKDPEKLFDDKNFVDKRGVIVNRSRIIRTRPIFREWELVFDVQFIETVVNKSNVIDALTLAGQIIGLCDYRPKYGRFEVVEIK